MIDVSGSDEGPLVSYVLSSYNRREELTEAIESIRAQQYDPIEIVVVSSSTDDTATLFEDSGRFDTDEISFYHFTERLNNGEARNVGYERANGDVYVTIDDDAVLEDPDATETVVSTFCAHEDVGALAFQSRDYDTGTINSQEIPESPDVETPPTEPYLTTSFVGLGFAIRPTIVNAVGGFPEDFEYGFDDNDLAIRVLNHGYDILYLPSVVVRHKKSPKGRIPDDALLERRVENRIRLTVRNFPWRYVICSTVLWTLYGLAKTRLRPDPLWTVFRRLYDSRRELRRQRNVVDPTTIALLKARSSGLFLWVYGPHPRRIFGRHGNIKRLGWN